MAIPAILEQRMRRCDLARLGLTHGDCSFLVGISKRLLEMCRKVMLFSFGPSYCNVCSQPQPFLYFESCFLPLYDYTFGVDMP